MSIETSKGRACTVEQGDAGAEVSHSHAASTPNKSLIQEQERNRDLWKIDGALNGSERDTAR